MSDEPTFFEAFEAVSPLLGVSQVVALMSGAERAGVLTALREPATLAQVATETGVDQQRVAAVVDALLAHDVVEPNGNGFRLTQAWAALARPSSLVTLGGLLSLVMVEGRLLAGIGSGLDYWSMPAEDRLAYARGISPDPFSRSLVEALRAAAEHDPDARLLAAGGDYLELGCGVAGRILTYLQAFPGLRAVGVELAPDLAAAALERAERLGLVDRFEVLEQDARAFDRPGAFDFAFWSQFFFPEDSREETLRVILRSLRRGGVVWSPCAVDFDTISANPRGGLARLYAVRRILLLSWGVPERKPSELRAEFKGAGFADVTILPGSAQAPPRVRAIRP